MQPSPSLAGSAIARRRQIAAYPYGSRTLIDGLLFGATECLQRRYDNAKDSSVHAYTVVHPFPMALFNALSCSRAFRRICILFPLALYWTWVIVIQVSEAGARKKLLRTAPAERRQLLQP